MLVFPFSPVLTAFPALSKISNMLLRGANRPRRESGGFESAERETSFVKFCSIAGEKSASSVGCSDDVLFSMRLRMSFAVRRPSFTLPAAGVFVGLQVLLGCNCECNVM